MKKKKIIFGIVAIIVIILIIVGIILIQNKKEEEKVKQTLTEFISLINEKNYEEMYNKVSNMDMSKEDFITRNKNIYEGIESQNIKVENITLEKQEDKYLVNYHENMFTGAGEVEFDNQVQIEKQEKEYKLKWSSEFIFPQLADNQKVRISTIKAKRGEIIDRNNVKLASNGTILSCRNSTNDEQGRVYLLGKEARTFNWLCSRN